MCRSSSTRSGAVEVCQVQEWSDVRDARMLVLGVGVPLTIIAGSPSPYSHSQAWETLSRVDKAQDTRPDKQASHKRPMAARRVARQPDIATPAAAAHTRRPGRHTFFFHVTIKKIPRSNINQIEAEVTVSTL
ncbi:hypothetical protein E2C01_052064 [Portunus trituberculatus]|uniref:Uncharacterized protein n=1 Tax=Portunus trituberculatus TaxID=210409 RepID=A0A5B7GKG1_PORTR|nr:hypothetical protein [Portunus trituberculatus]